MNSQTDLYQQVILEHNRKPRNFKELAGASHQAEGFNPLCGDHLWVYLNVDQESVIQDVTFTGSGCAISKASASMMTSALKGLTVKTANELFSQFHSLLKGDLDPTNHEHSLGKLKIFAGIWNYPSRIKCAGLAWHAMAGALKKSESSISTES